jgi:TonB family protein
MPYFWPSSKDYYPAAARRRGDTGVVNFEFSIDGKGHARDVRQIYTATGDLNASARSLLMDVQFNLPPDWENKGYQKLSFTFEVHYALWDSGHPCAQLPLRVPDAQLVVICGSRL